MPSAVEHFPTRQDIGCQPFIVLLPAHTHQTGRSGTDVQDWWIVPSGPIFGQPVDQPPASASR